MGINKKIIETEAAAEGDFNVVTYSGNSSTQSITGVGFQPDLVWIKSRNINGANHVLSDSSRGASKFILPNLTNAEFTDANGTLSSFDSDGFTLSAPPPYYDFNISGNNYVAWCWRANGGSTSSNTNGSVTSTVQANQNAGFSIVKYDGSLVSGSNTKIGHGLSAAPELIILKVYEPGLTASNWFVYSSAVGPSYEAYLNTTSAFLSDTNRWNNNAATSTVFSVGSSFSTYPAYYGGDTIAYCFHSVPGYSKIGTYTGIASGNVNVTTGFQPDYVMVKCASHATTNWEIHDTKRVYGASGAYRLRANDSSADAGFNDSPIKFTSTGFYLDSSVTANSYVDYDANGRTYIYMAFKIT